MGHGEMTKAQRLELAAAEAPLLRNASEKTLARRVALVDKDGKQSALSNLTDAVNVATVKLPKAAIE